MSVLSNFHLRCQIASLVRGWRRGSGLPLIILPSTAASLQFAGQLSRDMPVAIIGNPRLLADWAPSLCAQARSPLDMWREVKSREQLPCAVISYPDQLIGVDPSFHKTTIRDRNYTFSIVEMMLLMKFQPPAYLGQAHFRGRGEKAVSTLTLKKFAGGMPAGLPKEKFDEWLIQLMRPVLECCESQHDGWWARDIFPLKMDDNFEKMLKLRLLEIEALLLMGGDLPEAARSYRQLLAELQMVRRKPLQLAA